MTQKDFPTSPPATGGDANVAADLITSAAFAMSADGDASARNAGEAQARAAIDARHPDVRVSVVAALARLERFGIDDLRLLLSDSASTVRRRAVEAAAQLAQRTGGDAELAQALLPGLADDASVTEVTCFALGEFGPDAPVSTEPALEQLSKIATEHPDPLCRESAVAALGALHQRKHVILAALGDKATVRRRAVLALAPFHGDDVTAALTAALTDRDWQVRQAAEDLLG